jgi:hypothetical protein
MEGTNPGKELEKHLAGMEDWYKAVVFDTNNKVLAVKNVNKVDDKELT